MTDVDDVDGLSVVVNGVPNSILAASGSPVALERLTQRRSDAVRALGQRTVEELHAGNGDGFG